LLKLIKEDKVNKGMGDVKLVKKIIDWNRMGVRTKKK